MTEAIHLSDVGQAQWIGQLSSMQPKAYTLVIATFVPPVVSSTRQNVFLGTIVTVSTETSPIFMIVSSIFTGDESLPFEEPSTLLDPSCLEPDQEGFPIFDVSEGYIEPSYEENTETVEGQDSCLGEEILDFIPIEANQPGSGGDESGEQSDPEVLFQPISEDS